MLALMWKACGRGRYLAPAACLAIGVLLPVAAAGQGNQYARVAVTTTQEYDDNLFSTRVEARQSDAIFRVGPAIEAGHLSTRFELVVRYALDAERYFARSSLTSAIARQDAGITLRHAPTRRIAVVLGASYVDTNTPRDLNLETGLSTVRADAARFTAKPSVQYDLNLRTRVTTDYEFTKDRLVGLLGSDMHGARLGILRRIDLRNRLRVEYRFRSFGFGSEQAQVSHTVVLGLEREITRAVGVEVSLGPRLTDGTIRAEVAAALRTKFRRSDFSLGYSRTEATAIGEPGALDVQRLFLAFTCRRIPDLAVSVAPAAFSVARRSGRASIYALDVEAVRQITTQVSLGAVVRINQQRGTFAGEYIDIPHRTAALKLTVTVPRTTRVPGWQPRS